MSLGFIKKMEIDQVEWEDLARGMREYLANQVFLGGVPHVVALEPVCPASGLPSHPPGTYVQVQGQLEPTSPDCLAPPSGVSFVYGVRLSLASRQFIYFT